MKQIVKLLIISFLILLCLTIIITILSEITISIKDVVITYPLIAKIIHQTLEYMSWIGMPLILFSIADQHKHTISTFIQQQTEYWKNIKDISESERDLVPFPINIDTEANPEKIIIQALEDLKELVDSSDICIVELPEIVMKKYADISKYHLSESEKWEIEQEIMMQLFGHIELSIPNRTSHMEKYLLQLRVFIFEYKVQLDPNNQNILDLEKYKNELKLFIETTSLTD